MSSLVKVLPKLVKCATALGLENIRLTGEDSSVDLYSINDDNTVILFGKTKDSIDDIQPQTSLCLCNMDILRGITNTKNYDDTKVSVKMNTAKNVPERLIFKDDNNTFNYTLGGESILSKRVQSKELPPFELNFVPALDKINQFSNFASILGKFERMFYIYVNENKELVFEIGNSTSSTSSAIVKVSDGLDVNFQRGTKWDIQKMLSIFKLTENMKTTVSIAVEGGLTQIKAEDDTLEYTIFVLPNP